jgi:AcrR family transcriptional regulator
MPATSAPDAPTDLRARRRTRTLHEIQQAAITLFERQGFEVTTVDEIARDAGVSARTFFRYFTTKEESVLADMHGFDEALRECVVTTDPTNFSLADVEAAFTAVIEGFRDEQSEVARTIARIQKLVCANPSLSTAVVGRCSDNSQRLSALVESEYGIEVRSHVRLILEIAQLALRFAFDEWVSRATTESSGADLLSIYQDVCGRVRNL